MFKVYLLFLGLLVCSVFGEGAIQTTHIDFAGTYEGDMNNLMTRVQKKVDVKYGYMLLADGKLNQFPDMAIEFQLEFAQEVDIKYRISTHLSAESWLFTSVWIDGVENSDFRFCTGWFKHHAHTDTESIWMQAGKHLIQVRYATSSNYQMDGNAWWANAIFKVKYFKK